MNYRFDKPFAVGAPRVAAAMAIRAVEVVQSVQRIGNRVPLIAGKDTVVRVYPDPNGLAGPIELTCELSWRREVGGGAAYLPTVNRLTVDPATTPALLEQRGTLQGGFFAMLPAVATTPGDTIIRVTALRAVAGGHVIPAGNIETKVTFLEAPPLRIRAVGLRYRSNGNIWSPQARHFDYLRSFLRRAYPVASVEWSQIVVDANFAPPFDEFTSTRANAQLAAIRSVEVSNGTDPRTHYFGLVDDANGAHFMRGRATAIPGVPSPDTVASGPAGTPGGYSGDFDASYADWYGAHELGHTFGRYHPGFPSGQQDASDPTFPYPDGRISDDADAAVGFDVGDPTLGLPMRALPGTTHHDVMTYAERQWVSEYTFGAILTRLRLENEL